MYCWIQFASILLRIFASMFIRDIGLQYFLKKNVYFWQRERETDRQSMSRRGAERQGDTESEQAPGSELSAQNLTWGSNSRTVKSWPEPVGSLTNWAIQVPFKLKQFWRAAHLFPFGAVMNNTAMNIYVQVFEKTYVCISFGSIPRCGNAKLLFNETTFTSPPFVRIPISLYSC